MRDDDRIEEIGSDTPVFSVAPVRARTRVPRAALLGLTIGIAAFVAGLGVASSGPSLRTPPTVNPVGSPARSPAAVAGGQTAEPPAGTPAPTPAFRNDGGPGSGALQPPTGAGASRQRDPGSSTFLAGFDPGAIFRTAAGGDRCRVGEALDKEVPRTRRDGPRLTYQRTWMTWCPIDTAARQAFMLDVFDGLVGAIPADTFGYSASLAGTGDALLPYGEAPFAGTVTVSAGSAGRGLAIALVVTEWRTDTAP
jgi:hypothetical protein